MNDLFIAIIQILIVYIAIKLPVSFLYRILKEKFKDKDKFIQEEKMRVENTIKAEEFYLLQNKLRKKGFASSGVYIFTNQRNRMSYVGQSVDLIRRINEHMSGRGNQSVHEAMKAGDKFNLKLIKLSETEFDSLDKLEKYYITKLNSYYNGYNKTKGNG